AEPGSGSGVSGRLGPRISTFPPAPMIAQKKKIVLFLPHRADPTRGEMFSADLLPLELLQIATGPAADGYPIVLIDAMIEPDYIEKVLEACDGALCFASSCILGYQVYDGFVVAQAVREK